MEPEIKPLLVMGTRPYSAVLAGLIAECPGWRVAGFIENLDRGRCKETIEGLPIHWVDEIGGLAADHWTICSLATTFRDRFVDQVAARGMRFASIVHPRAYLSRQSTIGEGSFLDVGAIVAGFTSIGRHVRVSRGATIGHHTVIEDFVTLSPGVNIAGNCRVGKQTFIGMGANVIQELRIGSRCVIGAGAVVVRDLPDRVQAMGEFARVVREDIEGM